ncbi:succinate dehydrogenase assembly factor 2 [Psychrobium sp. MM17-31]|jgi:antitoxin CptB|uniref:FAD assembly factor SdhE n=1 Tax=Psychrobium sp. MM17-31 TaxID=2917758 RepID=UPI001EF52849|nr:succinate dehydrogenase assembly factor 2 [Psychrobium sp. MM17-31]MCG7530961.1 succinate dehydrogenase assembly factor 2 [Psychrobium sp. MM17-31]
MSNEKPTLDKPRLRWACRRGMLELDVLFSPFVEEAWDDLNDVDKATFERLLRCDDPDLFAWAMGHQKSDDPALQAMMTYIVNRVKV